MKKTVSIFVAIVFGLLSFGTYAEQSQEPAPILFRGIPWGANIPTALASLDGISFSDPSTDYACTVDYYMLEDGEIKYTDHVCAKMYARSRSISDMKVAGYELNGLNLLFAFTPDDSGMLPKDEEHTALAYADYEIKPKDLQFVMNDLLGKLTKTYGEPAGHQTKGSSIAYDIYYWTGTDGTIVSLVGKDYKSGSTEVSIRYSFYGAEDYFQKAMDALVYEELLKTDTEDTSGL